MPSHSEPCGLNQIYSLKSGKVPVARKTGGLADTVRDLSEINSEGGQIVNGFTFEKYSGKEMLNAVIKAVEIFHQKEIWNTIIANGMKDNFSWEESAKEYLKLYNTAIEKRKKLF